MGDICTPSFSVSGSYADTYLMTELMEVSGIALLVVSDNSATGAALVGRSDEEQAKYDKGRNIALPELVMAVAQK